MDGPAILTAAAPAPPACPAAATPAQLLLAPGAGGERGGGEATPIGIVCETRAVEGGAHTMLVGTAKGAAEATAGAPREMEVAGTRLRGCGEEKGDRVREVRAGLATGETALLAMALATAAAR